MTDDSGTWNFEYNADGLRVYRSNGTTEYKYYYHGSKLTRMAVNDETISFGYDASGTPQYVLYDGSYYFYLTNLQGDVTAIVNTTGETVVEYSYDAWGNVLETTGTLAETLGKLNPLRYRGYVYDRETGLHYLQSRYYDPELGRFINADIYTSTGQGFVGNNMFAYCNNNPIIFRDNTGTRMEYVRFDSGAPVGFPSPNAASQYTRFGEKASTAMTNTEAQEVLVANLVAFYKGRLVVKVPGSSSFSFGIIFMGNDGDTDLLNHEYGHTMQLKELGVIDYSTYVVLPSVICYWGTELGVLPGENYYSYPWEYQADQYGGVTRTYKDWAKDNAAYYWNLVS